MESIKTRHRETLACFEAQRQKVSRLWNIEKTSAELLYMLALIKKARYILEIGTSNGFSTFWLSLAAEQNDGIVHTIEVDKNRWQMAKDNLKTRKNIILHNAKAEEIIADLPPGIDLLFIDANKPAYIDYIKILEPSLAPGALVIADNIISHSQTTLPFRRYMENSPHFYCQVLDLDSGLFLAHYNIQ
jgi:predicted O-methyltransferase YrrM